MPDGLRLALTTFTVLRVRGPADLSRRTAGWAMTWAPLVGLGLGLVVAAVVTGVRELTPSPAGSALPAVLGIGLLALLTRGLHLDGVTDTVDGLASYQPPEAARRIMKAPDVGALGVAALVLLLATQVAALATCISTGRGSAGLLLAVVTGRVAVLAACTAATPAAAPDGLGALVAGTVRRGVPLAVGLLTAAVGAVLESFDEGGSAAVRAGHSARVLVAVTAGLLVARGLRRHCVRRLGGITGDVLGLLLEATTTVVLVVMALELPPALRTD